MTLTPLEQARKTRLLLDRLAKDASDAEGINGKPEDGTKPSVLQQTPLALRNLSKKLSVDYEATRDAANALTPEEAEINTALIDANKIIAAAQAARNEARSKCQHRIGLQDPIINTGNGAAIYPDHPVCLICNEEYELEWYCQESQSLRCEYPNSNPSTQMRILGGAVEEVGGEWAEMVECVHCGQPWSRSR